MIRKDDPCDPARLTRVRLFLTDLRLHGSHGVYEEERAAGNDFSVDVEVEGDLAAAVCSDRLEFSVDVDHIAALVHDVHRQQPFYLIESFADAIARAVMGRFPLLTRVVVRVTKLTVRRLDSVRSTAAEIVRTRGDG